MRFLSICSGIEAASVAFRPLGWEALAFAEIEPFPCRLLAHHYPQVPNLGDLTRWREWSPELLAQADVLCGGTPCQAFSVAGLRGSLNDERGNLTLTFCHLYDEIDRQRHLHGRPPAVCLWENVPGVLNTPDNAFGHFLAGLAGEDVPLTPPGARWTDAGYVRGPRRAVAWRTLDAQYFGLAQRRERVFVVASADPAFDPAAVLFELDGLRRDTPPRRGAGEGAAAGTLRSTDGGGGLGTDAECDGAVIPEQFSVQNGVPEVIPLAFGGNNTAGPIPTIPALNANRGCHNPGDFEAGALLVETVCAPLTGNAYADNASQESKLVLERAESGERRAESPEAFAFKASHFTRGKDGAPAPTAPPLSADADKGDQDTLVAAPIAFSSKDHGADATRDLCPTLRAGNHADSHANGGNAPAIAFPERMSGTQCASDTELSPVLQSRNPTAVAFQPGNLSRGAGSAPSTEVFPTLKSDHGRGKSDQDPHVAVREVAPAITGNYGKQVDNSDTALGPMVVAERQESFAFDLRGREGGAMPEGPHATANIRAGSGGSSRSYVAQKADGGGRRAEGGEPLPFDTTQITSATNRSKPCAGDPCHPIASQAHPPAVAFAIQERAVSENPLAGPDGVGVRADDCAYTLEARQVPQAVAFEPAAFTLHGSREGTQAVASPTDTAGTIREGTGTAIQNSSTTVALSEVAQPLRSNPHNNSDPSMEATMHVLSQPRTENREPGTAWRVRRLTPEECEILQGFPVGYTLIPVEAPMQSRPNAKPRKGRRKGEDLSDTIDYLISLGLPQAQAEVLAHSPDGPRYKALGNSWAVPVARWIARRIQKQFAVSGSKFQVGATSNPVTPPGT